MPEELKNDIKISIGQAVFKFLIKTWNVTQKLFGPQFGITLEYPMHPTVLGLGLGIGSQLGLGPTHPTVLGLGLGLGIGSQLGLGIRVGILGLGLDICVGYNSYFLKFFCHF